MHIELFATYAHDIIIDANNKKTEKIGGPAFWLKKTFSNLKFPHTLHNDNKFAKVEITIENGMEHGIIKKLPKINPIKYLDHKSGAIISTIGDEFDLGQLQKFNNFIALDVQGYTRMLEGKNRKFHIDPGIAGKINLFKATENEAKRMAATVITNAKSKLFLVTKGRNGFVLYHHGKKYTYKPNRIIRSRDAIGAGDTLLGSFVVHYFKYHNPKKAAKFAQKYVENFLTKKSDG